MVLSGSGRAALALLRPADPARPVAFHSGRIVSLAEFQRDAAAVAQRLPAGGAMINLCEDRYWFLASFAAAASVGHTVLLPSSRAEQVVKEVEDAGSYRWSDEHAAEAVAAKSSAALAQQVPPDHTVMIGFTSGSTGEPKRFPKSWGSVAMSTARNAEAIRAATGLHADDANLWVVATVPPQHMYGMELSVLLPLLAGMPVHADRPLFPADVARALAEVPAPRVLVGTPVHLRALTESAQPFPEIALIVSATAPLDRALAGAVERRLGGRLLEMFGSTETCVFAHRRTAAEDVWQPYEGVTLRPLAERTSVDAPWFREPVLLQDMLEIVEGGGFLVRGRSSDMIDVAGKRASLADLTRRLLAIEGVCDAVLFQPESLAPGSVRRLAALVVAPGLDSREIIEQLARSIDPAFLPRPLVLVEALPRNEVGKVTKEHLVAMLRSAK